ncbi:hypothetical protein FUA23_04380 [Neolewinella aurantiaca]|uniref:DUF4846 domain-containing protein n=1 Tax=Neolewinella aurantiaca TaxID=2602767 RepID=A0A5C7G091_9BACT|nr:DUF4846 domain-containing protein [Neolewinella aurantiaca]TXF91046.1 hypothetical protein FUA23_04380 [Neolewinella aurantiaca]
MIRLTQTLLLLALLCTCGPASSNATEPIPPSETAATTPPWLNPDGTTIATRFVPPAGFVREEYPANGFGTYLQLLPLKKHGTAVHLYNGEPKNNQSAHAAVLDVSVGKRDLQQCADAIMRLRADYLLGQERYADIHFNFVSGFNAEYTRWRRGERIKVSGNKVSWVQGPGATPGNTAYRKYLTMVFSYAGTASLVHELTPKENNAIEAGDVLIKGGSPGHAVIVVDKAVHPATGEIMVLLAQSYMPAQDIHVLVNPGRPDGNPWYSVNDFGKTIRTAEYIFREGALHTW